MKVKWALQRFIVKREQAIYKMAFSAVCVFGEQPSCGVFQTYLSNKGAEG